MDDQSGLLLELRVTSLLAASLAIDLVDQIGLLSPLACLRVEVVGSSSSLLKVLIFNIQSASLIFSCHNEKLEA